MIYKVGEWYFAHLGGQKQILFITDDEHTRNEYCSLSNQVVVLSLQEYIEKYIPNPGEVLLMYRSLNTTEDERVEGREKEYTEHLKPEVLEAGIKAGKYIVGTLNVNKHLSSREAFVPRIGEKNKGTGDILISGMRDRNRAIQGDRVVVELAPKSEWKARATALIKDEEEKDEGRSWSKGADVMPTGRVLGILERNWREYIATLPSDENAGMERATGRRVLVCPFDRRIPKIRIQTTQLSKLQGTRVLVRIDNWQVNSQYPQGHLVKCLGKIGDLETEIDSILVENSIEVTPFSDGILKELPSLESAADWKPDPAEVTARRDLRDTLVMSIDPRGCEDVDDTISIKHLENGNVEIGVHIADVTHFVEFNSLTDMEARKRATTVYLADRRYDMLPSVLSANLCSLLGNVERYAVSVIWEIHPTNFKVRKVWYGRTLIRSSYKLCYEDAQDVINGKSKEEMQSRIQELKSLQGVQLEQKYNHLKDNLVLLSKIASRWESSRQEKGALNLESSEVQFEFQESSLESIKPKEHLEIHETVAECMIMANHWVARKIADVFPAFSLLRLHPPPKKENFDELKKCAGSRGWTISTESNKLLASSLASCVDQEDPSVNFLLKSLATYAMVQAEYFSTGSVPQEDWSHYGLALDKYTHFTSPIRRYADVIVHRLLLAALEKSDWWKGGETSSILFNNSELKDLCQHINGRNRSAQLAQRMSAQLFQTLYFKGLPLSDPRCIVDAVVLSLRSNGFIVYIPAYALKGPVYLENKAREVIYKGEHGLVWQKGIVTLREHFVKVDTIDGTDIYRIFDHVTVSIQLKGSEAHGHELSYVLLDNKGFKTRPGEERSVNFLSAAREKKSFEDSASEDEKEEELKESKVFRFFQNMRDLGTKTLEDNL
ncbi:DIS3-like exonuclease 1 [Eurytemora carolleeae]|uniref:DIS3-like exonuclease 1 n=1 Tax=Eurytemora carolleeae TaxID=1294199 RepID=UPI000C75BE18|nr:DIS3-like exonuclease 1 [Eurytemora carolleeae]XP_023335143.1 DIS3-like exonuclease 1 [Eurytemora carolleeae]XP_023335144.1 DIS3-like exonuclease 1 [Eurytemora carolleeae]|eukprot:XP_023335142.1 DIS3-like exonuclease 1 [Eurytemora affinis]